MEAKIDKLTVLYRIYNNRKFKNLTKCYEYCLPFLSIIRYVFFFGIREPFLANDLWTQDPDKEERHRLFYLLSSL